MVGKSYWLCSRWSWWQEPLLGIWLALSPLLTVASGGLGGYLGFEAGKQKGGDIGHKIAMKNETYTPEFIRWQGEKYATIILPALSRYVDLDESKKQFMCPITLDWMIMMLIILKKRLIKIVKSVIKPTI
ncbi:MAG: hypothetical protein C5B45_06735 [Chlamydiae bacterium]|nr:MAG: hypothetical protein C5B45_06735 [Chlamydiota bacterium]